MRRQATPLFGEDVDVRPDVAVDLDAAEGCAEDGDADVDNWLIDDIGGGLEDRPDHGKSGLREVGELDYRRRRMPEN